MVTVLCRLCDQLYDRDELVLWKHTEIDGGSTFDVCPHCAAKAIRLGLENDYNTAIKLGDSITMVDDKED
jgi:hypothetical protein